MIYTALQKLVNDFLRAHGSHALWIEMHPADEQELFNEISNLHGSPPTFPLKVQGVEVTTKGYQAQGWATAKLGTFTVAHMLPNHALPPSPNVGGTVPTSHMNHPYDVVKELTSFIVQYQRMAGDDPDLIEMQDQDFLDTARNSTPASGYDPITNTFLGIGIVSYSSFAPGQVRLSGSSGQVMYAMKPKNSLSNLLTVPANTAINTNLTQPGSVHYTAPSTGTYHVTTNYLMQASGSISKRDGVAKLAVPTIARPKCECGSSAVGSNRHSSWCPKHEAA